jgi:hypothetical protein
LYYDNPTQRSNNTPRREFALEMGESNVKDYLEKVSKLIPSEILTGYITMVGLTASVRAALWHKWIYLSVFLFCLALTPAYLAFQSEAGKPRLVHLLVSSFAFVIWAYAVSGFQTVPNLYDPGIASISLISFTLLSGLIPLRK